jgi:hypothetical protein
MNSVIKQQIVNEIHKPARRNFKRRSVILKGIDDLWQADLIEMIPHARINGGYKYILVVIDGFSKYAWTEPLKNKTSSDVTNAFQKILKLKRIPKNLQTDQGKEFFNTPFTKLMKKYDINHYATFSNIKACIAERFNRTLKNRLWKQFSLQGSYKWTSILPNIMKSYNNIKHRTIKMKPSAVKGSKIEKILLETVYSKLSADRKKSKFVIDDYVRISKYRSMFAKGYTPSWTAEIFKIVNVNKTKPVTYHISDKTGNVIQGGFYEEELQKVKHPDMYLVEKIVKRKDNKVLVKWLGFDSSHNTWENEKNLYK